MFDVEQSQAHIHRGMTCDGVVCVDCAAAQHLRSVRPADESAAPGGGGSSRFRHAGQSAHAHVRSARSAHAGQARRYQEHGRQ